LQSKRKERDESPGDNPVYFHLLKERARGRDRKGPGPGNSTFSNPPPPFRTTENFPETAQNLKIPSEKCCTNPAYQVWKQVQTKLKTTQKGASEEYKIMSWIAYYDDQCRIHLFEKEGAGWFPQGKTVVRSFGRHKGKALMETWDSTSTKGKGRSTSPENDQYPENDHHFI
jgi:hypothetical protein